MLRVFFDTNLFVSSLLVKNGLPAQALDAWRSRRFLLVTSPAIMTEVDATLKYPRIRRKYSITDEDVNSLLELMRTDALVVSGGADVAGSVPDDPDDEIVLAGAIDGEVDLIVSGDRHLLSLTSFQNIPIITVRELLDRLTD